MALIKCKECGATIPDKTKACPKCGCQVDTPKRFGKLWIALGVLALVFIIGGSVTYFKTGKSGAGEDTIHKDTLALQTDLVVKLTPEFCKAVRKYNSLSDFKDGFAVVEKGEKWGVINTEGKEVVPCVYDLVGSFNEELAVVCKNDKWGFVNTKGELAIPCTYDFAFDFSEGLVTVRKNGKYGFINKKGEVAIPLEFEECGIFSEGLAYARDKKGDYFIDTKGEIKIRLPKNLSLFDGSSYDSSYPTFHNGTCSIVVGDDYNYVINTNGEKVTPPKPQPSAPEPASEYEVFRNDKGLVGVKNVKTNKIVVPAKYSSIGKSARDNNVIELHNGVVVATLDYKEIKDKDEASDDEDSIYARTYDYSIYGYIDMEGNETFTSEDYKLAAEKNSKYEQDKKQWQE